ncbi:MAG TPA: ABC transporter ATP-binding protein [Spirochaetia bacterium]|nr:ABC transporter ATP-binding protein [Spirochaetia bacterium]
MFRLFRFLKPYTRSLFFVVAALFAQAIGSLYLPTLMADIVNNGAMSGDTGYIVRYGGYMLIVGLGSAASAVAAAFVASVTAIGFGRDVRDLVFTRAENYSLHEFDKFGTASLITRTTNDVTQVQTVLVMGLRFMIFAPVMMIGGIIMALSKDRHLSLILLVVLPVMASFMWIVFARIVPLFQTMQSKLDRVNLVLRENLTGIRVIRAFNRQNSETVRFDAANSDLTDVSIRVNQFLAVMLPFVMLVLNVTTIAVVWFGGLRIGQNLLQIGDMMAFLQYAMMIVYSVMMVTLMFVMIPRAQASAVRINDVLDLKPEIVDPLEPKQPEDRRGTVEFRDVTFSYPGAEMPAISHISFATGPGEVTAIIGGTGSGKSTLINLVPRFYDVDSGCVLVDGMDVREMAMHDLRGRIGLVPQNPVLFSETVAGNIRYGKLDASEEEVAYAAEVAQASDFIAALPQGYASQVAQGGANLSGGQKQRLSIARALVRKPGIYILDDALSALDFKTDARLRAALKKETAAATVIIVAQRVGTIRDADRIIVMDGGQVVGMGTHQDLLVTCQVYREIVSSQLSEEEIAG